MISYVSGYPILTTRKIRNSKSAFSSPWGYKCIQERCQKVNLTETPDAEALEVCRIFCKSDIIGTLWPKPSGEVKFKNTLEQIHPDNIKFHHENSLDHKEWWELEERFRKQIDAKYFHGNSKVEQGGKEFIIVIGYKTNGSGNYSSEP
jgi:hypothetical protein